MSLPTPVAGSRAPTPPSTTPLTSVYETSANACVAIDDRVFVKSGATTRFVPVNQIASVNSAENYTSLQLIDGSHLLALRPLKSWESTLPTSVFARIHRQSLVNLNHVKAIVRSEPDPVNFQFHHGLADLSASRRRLSELRQKFADAGLESLLP